MAKAKDLSGLLLLHTSRGDAQGLEALAADAKATGKQNVSFLSSFLLGRVDECIDVLVTSGRVPEAAFFARTYRPSRISEVGPSQGIYPIWANYVITYYHYWSLSYLVYPETQSQHSSHSRPNIAAFDSPIV